MAATSTDLLQHLERLGIPTETVEHPAVFTVDEAKALRGELPGAHSKNLFLKDKKSRFWLVVALEDRAIDLKALRKSIGAAQLSFGKPEALMEKLGIEPGSVTPFSVINDADQSVTVVLDEEMLTREPLNFHPLVNTATTQISADGLLAFLRDCGHDPIIATL
jgi:Ala-tRNA(Pro) deacylase